MKIGFDATPFIYSTGGIARYAKNLLQAILDLKSNHTIFGYVPRGASSKLPWPAGTYSDNFAWKGVNAFNFKYQGFIDDLDLYHGTNFKLQTSGSYGTVLTIHDLWLDRFPEYSKKPFGQKFSFYRTRKRAQKARRVIAVSHFTSSEIQTLYGLPEENISVIHSGISSDFFPDLDEKKLSQVLLRHGIPSRPYILFVGGADPRKNHETLFRAFSNRFSLNREWSLIAIGNQESRGRNLLKTKNTLGLEGKVYSVNFVSNEELRLLYSFADVFVFPSKYEGFGFPVLEAMSCGAPVVANNVTSIPEIAGDAAILVDAEDEESLGEGILRILYDEELSKELRAKGLKQIQQFSWAKTARETIQIYQGVCDKF